MKLPNKSTVDYLKNEYPTGTKVELLHMEDTQAPPLGTKGIIKYVDDAGTLHVGWENGSSLGLIYGEDQFKKITELTHSVGFGFNVLADFKNDDLFLIEKLNEKHQPYEYVVCRGLYEDVKGTYSWAYAVGYCQTKEQGYNLFADKFYNQCSNMTIAKYEENENSIHFSSDTVKQCFGDALHMVYLEAIQTGLENARCLLVENGCEAWEFIDSSATIPTEELAGLKSELEDIEFDADEVERYGELKEEIHDKFIDFINDLEKEVATGELKTYMDVYSTGTLEFLIGEEGNKATSIYNAKQKNTDKSSDKEKPSLLGKLNVAKSEVKRESNEQNKTVSKER